MEEQELMAAALAEARRGVAAGEGGPFGAVVARAGEIVGRGRNQVLLTGDPTAHAEIQAIRDAARAVGRRALAECEIYTTCEPCPMCLAAIHWARLRRLCYGCPGEEAARVGFDDRRIREWLREGNGTGDLVVTRRDEEACRRLFREWEARPDREFY